jgi:hypothetical protein
MVERRRPFGYIFALFGLFTQPLDEANPATWISHEESYELLLQVAGWLISFSLGGTQRLNLV